MFRDILVVILAAASPVGELRLSIPLALGAFKMPVIEAFILSILGNMIPPLILVNYLEPVSNFLRRHIKLADRFFAWLFSYTRHRHQHKFENLKEDGKVWGTIAALITIVAIPLPFTGAYSGSLAAFVFGVPPKISLPAIFIGVLIAGVIVTSASLGFFPFLETFILIK